MAFLFYISLPRDMKKILVAIAAFFAFISQNIAQTDVDTLPVTINKFEAKIVPKSNVVIAGDKFEADIYLVAYDTNKKAEVHINGWKDLPMENSTAKYVTYAVGEGKQDVSGFITYFEGDRVKKLFFATEYTVMPSAVNFSIDNLNVFYVGIDNPFTVSIPGVEPQNVVLAAANGTLTSLGGGKYNINVAKQGEVRLIVKAKSQGAPDKMMGAMVFKALPLPNAQCTLGTLKNGSTATAKTISQSVKLSAAFDESFPYAKQYTVEGFTVSIYSANGQKPISIACEGEHLSQEAQTAIAKLITGDKVLIEAVKLTAEGKSPIHTAPFILTVE